LIQDELGPKRPVSTTGQSALRATSVMHTTKCGHDNNWLESSLPFHRFASWCMLVVRRVKGRPKQEARPGWHVHRRSALCAVHAGIMTQPQAIWARCRRPACSQQKKIAPEFCLEIQAQPMRSDQSRCLPELPGERSVAAWSSAPCERPNHPGCMDLLQYEVG
jgi:hypothetical protein